MFAFIAGVVLATSASLVSSQSPPSRELVNVADSQSLRSVGYDKCMSTAIDGSEGNEPPARLTTCTGSDQQRWILSGTFASGFQISPRANKNLCLDIDGHTMDDESTRVIFYKCQSSNKFQRWTVVPIKTGGYLTHYAILNVGFVGSTRYGTGANMPKALTISGTANGSELVLAAYGAGDLQLPKSRQLWRSEEVYCYQAWRKHANGLWFTQYSAGGHTSSGYDSNCQ
jgi:hypothetical protein